MGTPVTKMMDEHCWVCGRELDGGVDDGYGELVHPECQDTDAYTFELSPKKRWEHIQALVRTLCTFPASSSNEYRIGVLLHRLLQLEKMRVRTHSDLIFSESEDLPKESVLGG